VPIRPQLALDARPRWLTTGTFRLLGLCAVIVVIGMIPGRLSAYEAGWVGWAGLALVTLGLTGPVLATIRRVAARLPLADALLLALRHAGLVGLGAAFFLFWTFVYLTLWWSHPHEAFTGLAGAPRFADFFYYAVSTAFISPPGDILAHSRGARSATMIEMMTGFALLAAYLSSFVDWGATRGGGDEPPAPRP
jgi:hypothetical protein